MLDIKKIATGKALRELREGAGVSQKGVADELGCSQSTVVRIEAGHRVAFDADVLGYAKAVGSTPAKIAARARRIERELRREVGDAA